MKIAPEQILHKTEVNGVRLDVNSGAEARSAFLEIASSAKQGAPEAHIACDDIMEIDVNPLSASADGVIAVDARILLG